MAKGYSQRESKAVDAIKKAIPPSLKKDMVPESNGMFAELYSNSLFPDHYMASAIDGVGTKILIAEAMRKYDTIGIDCVAMSANDLATLGAVSPFLFMDAITCQKKIEEDGIVEDIIKGIVQGLIQCDSSKILHNSIRANFGKGETASADELISSFHEGYGFDLVGSMIGFIEKKKMEDTKVRIGDKIIAFPSSGPHSNGYTALRHHLLNGDFETREEYKHLYKGKYSLDDKFDSSTIGKILLEPTKIYLQTIAKISKIHDSVGINNTGYGLKNFNRIKGKFEFLIDNPLKPNPIFQLMQKESKYSDKEMYESFNMGMGFFTICRTEDSDSVMQLSDTGKIVGEVRKSSKTRTVLTSRNKKIAFEGY
jgi:phosphoribosylformylglycinamidine cyclo-ligase